MLSVSWPVPVISFARISCPVSLPALQEDLHRLLQETWVDHVNRRDYQGGWDVLPLRCERQHQDAHPILQGYAIQEGEDWINLPALNQSPAMLQCVQFLQCPVKAVRLMRLKAGSHIKPHRDHQLSLEHGEARLHLPIFTGEHIRFRVNGQTVPMSAGELWYINADQEHEVHNIGEQDRINLVIDCGANTWLKNCAGAMS
ncbi:aspartyl/asparaginyl beta-hydroxylase domain-containing protein [Cellvibrio sp. KB43]|uniref:Aspartyl/asparaginyl beta-hydroxylase domain-containing protein n=1 Tax=Cellvibrio polysaccharolyticus TaxID=2082724 RepID=A0A928V138_9GAMM|nr:aspartyl/asparaginyl beta-hydroxylase domain-containing protein [Cellvibrio polysaccharolyticus]